MRKAFYAKLLKLGMAFVSLYVTFFGYVIHSNQVVIVEPEKTFRHHEVVQREEIVLDEVVPEVKEEVPSVQTVSYQAEPLVISGNSIRVGNNLYDYLMKDSGDNFYLNHNLSGEWDGRGVPMIDVRNDFTGRKTIIYAHSSPGGNGPFQALQNYHNNPNYYYQNRYITIQYEGNTYTYEIFSVYVSVADSEESDGLEYFREMTYRADEWETKIQEYKNHSEYDTGVSVSGQDKIIILQTCSMDPNYFERYYRYNLLVMGKLI